VAYVSDESGRGQIYVRPFPPGPGGKWQISTGGGYQPRWRRDGKELFFLSRDRKLMAAPVKAGAAFQPGLAQELFQTRMNLLGGGVTRTYHYAVSADGKRFLIIAPLEEAASAPITVVQLGGGREAVRRSTTDWMMCRNGSGFKLPTCATIKFRLAVKSLPGRT